MLHTRISVHRIDENVGLSADFNERLRPHSFTSSVQIKLLEQGDGFGIPSFIPGEKSGEDTTHSSAIPLINNHPPIVIHCARDLLPNTSVPFS